jgi:hypothetical protein
MNREDIEQVGFDRSEAVSLTTGKPMSYRVTGLPEHLTARIVSAFGGYQYELSRIGDSHPYVQSQRSPTPEAALQALKKFLNGDPI